MPLGRRCCRRLASARRRAAASSSSSLLPPSFGCCACACGCASSSSSSSPSSSARRLRPSSAHRGQAGARSGHGLPAAPTASAGGLTCQPGCPHASSRVRAALSPAPAPAEHPPSSRQALTGTATSPRLPACAWRPPAAHASEPPPPRAAPQPVARQEGGLGWGGGAAGSLSGRARLATRRLGARRAHQLGAGLRLSAPAPAAARAALTPPYTEQQQQPRDGVDASRARAPAPCAAPWPGPWPAPAAPRAPPGSRWPAPRPPASAPPPGGPSGWPPAGGAGGWVKRVRWAGLCLVPSVCLLRVARQRHTLAASLGRQTPDSPTRRRATTRPHQLARVLERAVRLVQRLKRRARRVAGVLVGVHQDGQLAAEGVACGQGECEAGVLRCRDIPNVQQLLLLQRQRCPGQPFLPDPRRRPASRRHLAGLSPCGTPC